MKALNLLFALVVGLVFSSATVSATSIPVQIFPPGDGLAVGTGSGSDVQTWLVNEVNTYNTVTPASLPTDANSLTFETKVDQGGVVSGLPNFGANVFSISFTAAQLEAYTYIVFHWGGPVKSPSVWQAFYLPSDVGAYTFNAPSGVGGLSGYYLFGKDEVSVPETSSTLALAGLATLGLLGFARRFKR